MTELLKREDQRVEDTWDLSSIFESDEAWEEAFKTLEKEIDKANDYKEKGINSAEDLLEVLEAERELGVEFGKLYVYSHLKHDQDTSNGKYQSMNNRASQLATKLSAAWSFLMPMLMHIDEETLNTYAEDEKLKAAKEFVRKTKELLNDKKF